MTILDSYVDTLNLINDSISIPILKDLSGYDFRTNHPRIRQFTRSNSGMSNNPIYVYVHNSGKEHTYMVYFNYVLTIFKNLKKDDIEKVIESYKENAELESLFKLNEYFDYTASYRVRFNNGIPKFSLIYFSDKNVILKLSTTSGEKNEFYNFILSRKGVNSDLSYSHSIIFPVNEFLNKNLVIDKPYLVNHFNWVSISKNLKRIVQLNFRRYSTDADIDVRYYKEEPFYPSSCLYLKNKKGCNFYYINPRVIQFMKDNEIKNPIAHFKGNKNLEDWNLLELMVGE